MDGNRSSGRQLTKDDSTPSRPAWRLPDGINSILAVTSFLIGAVGLIASNVFDTPVVVELLLWLLVSIPIAIVIIWIATQVYAETNVVLYRYRIYTDLFRKVKRLESRVENQSREIQELNLLTAATYLDSRHLQVVDYDIEDAILRSGVLFVTLNDDLQPLLAPGSILKIIDREDGMPLGTLQVTSERSGTGRCIAEFIDWDGLFLTGIRKAAERHEPVRTRSIARFVTSESAESKSHSRNDDAK